MIRKATVEGGVVVGYPAADPRITAFKGIPFAAPPVGENRWRAPQPVIPWEGEKECFHFAPISMQHVPGLDKNNIYSREWNVDPTIKMDEDCLYLNVWTPANATDEKLPVFVWYFGGGLREGNPAEMEFDGERIARRGIVVVTVNYRLNVFGFLSHPELAAQQPDAPSNFGHLDQQAGTRWVKRNIEAFGGDPNNITIGGQSAGGGSVSSQVTSPQNDGLFQKALIMSGMMPNVYPSKRGKLSAQQAQEQGVRFFEFLGVKTLEEARKVDAVTIRDKCEEFKGSFATTFDGKFQTEDFYDSFMNGKRADIPLIITRTSTEFANTIKPADQAELDSLAEEIAPGRAEEFKAIVGNDLNAVPAKSSFNSIEIAARTIGIRSAELGKKSPIYYGVFDPTIPGWDNPGTFHSSDLWFVWETLAKCWRPFKGYHYDLSRQMCNYLCNFCKTGNPNGYDNDDTPLPKWTPLDAEGNNAMWARDTGCEFRKDEPTRLVKLLTEVTLEKHK